MFADHVPTQPPYNQSLALDSTTGDLTVGIYSSDGFEDSPPEKYTIFFTISDSAIDTSSSFCVSTSFGHGQNLTWQYFVFKLDDLKTYFENPYGTFRTRIRADNDTDNSFSTLTDELTISIPNQEPFVGSADWSAPSSSCVDTSTTTTTSSTTSSSTTSSTTTSTTTTTLPPPPPPTTTTTTLAPVIVKIDGEEVEYTQAELEDGTIDRDKERAENENLYGCYMTNAQIERGDCDFIDDGKSSDQKDETLEIKNDDDFVKDEDAGENLEPENESILSDAEIKELELEAEKEAEIKKELEDSPLAEIIGDDDEKVQEFVDTIKKIQEETDFDSLGVDDEVIVVDVPEDFEIVIVEPEVEETEPIIEDFESDEVLEPSDPVEIKTIEDEVIEVVEQVVEKIKSEPIENLTEDEVVQVKKVVEVVKTVEQVSVLSEKEKQTAAAVLGVQAEELEVVAELAQKDEAVAEAVGSFVDRAVQNSDDSSQPYTLADAVVEVAVEEFLENPAVIFAVDFEEIVLTEIGNDMTLDQKEKAQEVVVPVIIASQIISSTVVPFRRIR